VATVGLREPRSIVNLWCLRCGGLGLLLRDPGLFGLALALFALPHRLLIFDRARSPGNMVGIFRRRLVAPDSFLGPLALQLVPPLAIHRLDQQIR
jgi:hypothetical protein